jgi:transposase-like protein
VPDSRPVTEVDAARVRAAVADVRTAQAALERAVAQALTNGASVRSVAELGLSANTVQKYGRAHGWPTEENRERFYESRYDREEREIHGDAQRA